MRELVQEPINTLSIATRSAECPVSAPYRPALFLPTRFNRIGKRSRIGNIVVHGNHRPGLVPQVTCGEISSACRVTRYRKLRLRRFAGFSSRQRRREIFAFRRMQTAFDIVKGGFAGATRPAFAPISIAILHRVIDLPCLNHELLRRKTPPHARCACAASFTDNCQHDIFCCNARAALPWTSIFMVFARPCFRVVLPVRVQLRKCRYQRPVRQTAVGGGMRVAADNGHPRQGDACSGPITWTIP